MNAAQVLSYNSQDERLARGLKAAIERKDLDARIFFAPESLRAGHFWSDQLAKEVDEANAFVLLVGENKVGPWQHMEYRAAFDRLVNEPNFPIMLVLLEGKPAPSLAFLEQVHWIVTADPTSEETLARLLKTRSA